MFCDSARWSANIHHIVPGEPTFRRAVPHLEGTGGVQLEGAEVGQDGAAPPRYVRFAATSQVPQEESPKFLVLKIYMVFKLG